MREDSNSTAPQLNMISEETELTGNLTTTTDIRIAGSLMGDLTTKGKVQATSTSRITGDIQASDVDFAGIFKGSMKVSRRIVLRRTARVEGVLHVKSLVMEEGAKFDGELRMSDPSASESNTEESSNKSKMKALSF